MLNLETYKGSFTRVYTATKLFFRGRSVVPKGPSPLPHSPVSFIVVMAMAVWLVSLNLSVKSVRCPKIYVLFRYSSGNLFAFSWICQSASECLIEWVRAGLPSVAQSSVKFNRISPCLTFPCSYLCRGMKGCLKKKKVKRNLYSVILGFRKIQERS